MRFIIILLSATLVAACSATRQEVVDRLGSKYVGQNVDVLVSEFGPPANTFKMNSGETSYMWQLASQTDIDTYKGSGTAETFYCKVNVIAKPSGVISKVTTQDAANMVGESLCAKRLGMQRST
jgi:hypothetical protein